MEGKKRKGGREIKNVGEGGEGKEGTATSVL